MVEPVHIIFPVPQVASCCHRLVLKGGFIAQVHVKSADAAIVGCSHQQTLEIGLYPIGKYTRGHPIMQPAGLPVKINI